MVRQREPAPGPLNPNIAHAHTHAGNSGPNAAGNLRFTRRAPSPGAVTTASAATAVAAVQQRRMSISPSTRVASSLASTLFGPTAPTGGRVRGKFVPLPGEGSLPEEDERILEEEEDYAAESRYNNQQRQRSLNLDETPPEGAEGYLGSATSASTGFLADTEASSHGAPLAARQGSDELSHNGGTENVPKPKPEPGSRLTTICFADAIDRKALEAALAKHEPGFKFTRYPEVLHVSAPFGESPSRSGDIFFFDYGCVVLWGMSATQESSLMATVTKHCSFEVLPPSEQQVDSFEVRYSSSQPNIRNDTITINSRQAGDVQVKLAMSHALAQCTKLSVYEERITQLVQQVRHLPKEMAEKGSVPLTRTQVAQLMGEVFLQKSAVNLMSSVLDTPEFFWRAPDSLQALYKRVCEYLDLEERIELCNARFAFLQSMLDIWRDHANHHHISRLDFIIVLLIVVEVIMAAAEVVGFIMHLH